jgi:hypothetical protein
MQRFELFEFIGQFSCLSRYFRGKNNVKMCCLHPAPFNSGRCLTGGIKLAPHRGGMNNQAKNSAEEIRPFHSSLFKTTKNKIFDGSRQIIHCQIMCILLFLCQNPGKIEKLFY